MDKHYWYIPLYHYIWYIILSWNAKTCSYCTFLPKTPLLWEQREQRITVVWQHLRHGINFIFSEEFEFFKIIAFWAFWRPNFDTSIGRVPGNSHIYQDFPYTSDVAAGRKNRFPTFAPQWALRIRQNIPKCNSVCQGLVRFDARPPFW